MSQSDKQPARRESQIAPNPDALPLYRIVRRSAAEEVKAQLVALIESEQLQVNERLPSEAELARRFGVSRPILREALGKLQALGFTESRPGLGTFVASNVTRLTMSFGQYSASDLNEVRRCVEVPAARLAAERRTDEDLERLRRTLDDHVQAARPEEAVAADSRFHAAIARATGNMLFVRLVEDVREILQAQSLAVSTLRDRGASAALEHGVVFEAIADRDGRAAAGAMDEHLDAVERAIREISAAASAAGLTAGSSSQSIAPRRGIASGGGR